MAIHRDENSPAHYYTEQWIKNRQKEFDNILNHLAENQDWITFKYLCELGRKNGFYIKDEDYHF